MARLETLTIRIDRDWLALNAYRMALESIVERAEREPWAVDPETARTARLALAQFPTSDREAP